MANGVLPSFLVLLIKREFFDNELIDLVQRQPFITGLLDSHSDECYITVRWFNVRIFIVGDGVIVFVVSV